MSTVGIIVVCASCIVLALIGAGVLYTRAIFRAAEKAFSRFPDLASKTLDRFPGQRGDSPYKPGRLPERRS